MEGYKRGRRVQASAGRSHGFDCRDCYTGTGEGRIEEGGNAGSGGAGGCRGERDRRGEVKGGSTGKCAGPVEGQSPAFRSADGRATRAGMTKWRSRQDRAQHAAFLRREPTEKLTDAAVISWGARLLVAPRKNREAGTGR